MHSNIVSLNKHSVRHSFKTAEANRETVIGHLKKDYTIVKIIPFIFIFLIGCTSYDKLLIYDKTHSIVETKLLRYNGFYYCNLEVKFNNKNCSSKVLPIFFYSDGTAFTSGQFCNTDSIKGFYRKAKQHSAYDWGSYKINENEITVEFYWPNSGTNTYERYHMKGRIDHDSIFFYTLVDRHLISKSIKSTYYFEPFETKPDSSLSFIKTRKKFN